MGNELGGNEKLNATVKEMTGIENFTDMICDETIASDSEGVLAFLEEKGHPALSMECVMQLKYKFIYKER